MSTPRKHRESRPLAMNKLTNAKGGFEIHHPLRYAASAMVPRPLLRRSAAIVAAALLLGCRNVLGIETEPIQTVPDAASDPSDAGAQPSYCETLSPKRDFCADFDHDALLTGWDNELMVPDPYVTGGGSISGDSANVFSAPRAATIEVPQLLKPQEASTALVKSFSRFPSGFWLEFDMRIDTEDFKASTQTVILTSLMFPTGQIAIARTRDGLTLSVTTDDRKAMTELDFAPGFVVGKWARMAVHVFDFYAGAGGRIIVQIDGIQVAEAPVPSAMAAPGTSWLGIGALGAFGNMGRFRVTYDNVWFNGRQ